MASDSRKSKQSTELRAVGDDLLDVTTEFSASDANADLLDETAQLQRRRRQRASQVRIHAVRTPREADADDQPATIEVGALLGGRYRLEELVHTGGMGRVFRAVDERIRGESSREVAIKLLRRQLANRDDLRNALEREAASLRQLAHPNIVNVFDFDEQDGQLYFVMEWLEGESAQSLLRRANGTPVERTLAWTIIESVARALHHAHSNGIVHADVNPSNVMIGKNGVVKLIDFGTCRDRKEEASEQKESAWATERYASPEVLAGEDAVAEDDLFSLACIGYRLMSGRHPFDGLPADEAKRQNVQPARLDRLTDDDWKLLSSALSFERSDRPRSAEPFFRRNPALPVQQREPAVRRSPLPVMPVSVRGRWPWAAAALAAIVAWGLWSLPSETTDTPPTSADSAPNFEPDPAPAVSAAADTEGAAEVGTLLERAQAALDEGRLVEPAGSSAHDLYQRALALDPASADAEAGLRAVGERLVERAQGELAAGRAAEASETLSMAGRIDPDNAAVAETAQAIRSLGAERLQEADTAIAAGDLGRATRALELAERFPANDAAAIAALRDRISAEYELSDRISSVDRFIAGRQLLVPAGANAFDAVSDLRRNYPDDTRVEYVSERLGAALVTRAITAMNADRFDEAEQHVAALRELGVMRVELAAAEDALQLARQRTVAAETSSPAEAPGTDAAMAAEGDLFALEPATSAADAGDDAGAAETDRMLPVSALDMQHYVPPRFPRAARLRNRGGYVDVAFRVLPDGSVDDLRILRSEPEGLFDDSAINAVSRWEFAARDDSVESRIRLSFDPG